MIAASRELTGRAGTCMIGLKKSKTFNLGVLQKWRKCHLINR